MASRSKKKTTMAKLNREAALRQRRIQKQAKKDARKRAAADLANAPDETSADALDADAASADSLDPDAASPDALDPGPRAE